MVLELITLVVVLAILGFAVWLVTTYVPMPQPLKQAIVVIVILVVLLWLARWMVTGGALFAR